MFLILIQFLFIYEFVLLNVNGETNRCLQPLDPGPCQFYQRRFYFDRLKNQCLPFDYGGCLGSPNKFGSEQECTRECVYQLKDKVKMPEVCLMQPNAGKCSDTQTTGQIWYYFNSESGICEQFQYFGCAAGNQNRFYSLYQCKQVCGERFDPQIACQQCDVRTSVCKAVSKYVYSCDCRAGYLKTEQGECIDMDECDLMQAECHEKARCINTIGSYRCECVENYVGDGKKECRYVGPASLAPNCEDCNENAICLNDRCRCKVGFEGDGLNCTDVNECKASKWPCDFNAECVNTEGSFYCQCLNGFAGNGHRCTTDPMSCLDRFDNKYKDPCKGGTEWHVHYHLDHTTKQCAMFWTDGCSAESRNIFSHLHACEEMCVKTNILSKADQCWDKFDSNLRNQCSRGEWSQKYFYDQSSMTCQLFWWDGCKSSSRNMFDDLLTCQWLCEEEPRYKTRACLEPFDEHYRDECNGGLWRQNYYFDKQKMRCTPFWFDGCTGQSANLFPDLSSCVQTCEKPVGELPSVSDKSIYRAYTNAPSVNPHTHPHRHHIQRPTPPTNKAVTYAPRIQMDRPFANVYDGGKSKNSQMVKTTQKPNENICETANPCENNSTCIYDKLKKSYYCECKNGYRGKNCTEFDDRDPCSKKPCKNGGTCVNKPDKDKLKINFECFCAAGFGEDDCSKKPCDPNPCHNNGTCRTTKGNPSFFCECPSEWGGKMCNVEIPNTNTRKYGKNVELLSSGKPEWIENLKKHKMRERKPSSAASMMETSSSSNYTEPDDDLHTLNETEKHPKKSQTLRLPAGEPSANSMLSISQTLILISSLFLFISKHLIA